MIDEKTTFDQKEWTYDNVLDHKLSITDTSKRYDLYLEIDHTTDYEFQNIYMNVYTKYPSGKELKQPLNLNLAEITGKWKGKCKGERCKALVVLQQNTYFNELGIQGGDVVKSINGTPINLESIRPIIGQSFGWTPETEINIVLHRGEEEIAVEGKVGAPVLNAENIVQMDNASEAQNKLREAWLKG